MHTNKHHCSSPIITAQAMVDCILGFVHLLIQTGLFIVDGCSKESTTPRRRWKHNQHIPKKDNQSYERFDVMFFKQCDFLIKNKFKVTVLIQITQYKNIHVNSE